jgi:hypothetical protein
MTKKPRQKQHPAVGKRPLSRDDLTSSSQRNPVWKIGLFDAHGPWGRNTIALAVLWDEIFEKLKNYESMTWADIVGDKKRNHSVPVANLIKQARDRLEEIRIEVDELFRFRLTGKMRVWGVRVGEVFHILWWDPDHVICPSELRHT